MKNVFVVTKQVWNVCVTLSNALPVEYIQTQGFSSTEAVILLFYIVLWTEVGITPQTVVG